MKDFNGQVAFITGGASGAGFGQAMVFGREGAKVVIADVRPEAIEKALGELRAAGITTIRDVLWFFPLRYEDRRHPVPIAELGHFVDTPVLLRGRDDGLGVFSG